MSKAIVAYFSVSGVTANVARSLARVEGADLYAITPAVPYTAPDLDWRNKESRSTIEMSNPDSRPALAENGPDLKDYDTVFLGFPVWWGREPSVVDTYLDAHDFSGKRVIPFCTSGGSDIGQTAARIRSLISPQATVDEGKRLGGEISPEDLSTWTEGLKA